MSPSPARVGRREVLTWANGFTALRLACVPVFAVLVLHPGDSHRAGAASLLAALGATDWVDGHLARRLGQVTSLGAVLDPLADRLLLATAAVTTIVAGAVPVWVAAVALAREAVVAAGFVYVAAAGGRRLEVSAVGKAATCTLMVALPLFLLGHSTAGWHRLGEALAWVAAVPALVLGWWSVAAYVAPGRRAVAAARVRRADRRAVPGAGTAVR